LIRILTQRSIRIDSWQRWVFHPDPDLLELGVETTGQASRRKPILQAFTRAVSSIRVGHIHKLTGSARLVETKRALARHLGDRGEQEIRLLDIGGSDGTTTLEAVRDLSDELGTPVRAVLMDRYVRIERRKNGWLREYCMTDGSPLILRLGPLGLQLSSIASTRDPLSRCIGRAYLAHRERHGRPNLDATLSLIHPAVAEDDRVSVVEWNVLEPKCDLRGQFDAVRASNILNENYFSREEIEIALSHIHAYLDADGLLLVSRNHLENDVEVEHGSLWRRTPTRFQRVEDFGSGSYVAHIVDEFRAVEDARSAP
jgi:hypothetical protein